MKMNRSSSFYILPFISSINKMEFAITFHPANWNEEIKIKLINLGYKIYNSCIWTLPKDWFYVDRLHYDDKGNMRLLIDGSDNIRFLNYVNMDIEELKQENKKLTEKVNQLEGDIGDLFNDIHKFKDDVNDRLDACHF